MQKRLDYFFNESRSMLMILSIKSNAGLRPDPTTGLWSFQLLAPNMSRRSITQNGKGPMSNKAPIRDPQEENPQTLAEVREEMHSDPDSLEKQQPGAPLALVMGAYPIILIILLISIAAFFVMSRRGTSNIEPGTTPATEVPVESSLPDPNP